MPTVLPTVMCIMLDEDGGLVTRYAVLAGNPPDAPELAQSLDHHQACFDQVPTVLTADRAFFTLENERLALDLRIRSIALPRQGPLTPKQKMARQSVAFRRAYHWRAGIGGRISVLKRRFVLDHCRYHGEAGTDDGSVGVCWPTTSAKLVGQPSSRPSDGPQ